MEKTITFEMTESQAEKFEKLLDDVLEVFDRMEKESPERQARIDKMHEEFQKQMAETKKLMEQTSQRLTKWELPLES